MRAVWLACALLLGGVAPTRADEPAPLAPTTEPAPASGEASGTAPAPGEQPRPDIDHPVLRPSIRRKEIVIDIPGERSRTNKLVLAATTAAGVIAGGVGLYWHLDSRSASNEVSSDVFTGHAWSAADEAEVARADRSRTRAAIAYTVGGAFITAAIVALIVTEPKSEQTVIRPHASLQPTTGGAVVGGMWSF
jgi:hypothetical protein